MVHEMARSGTVVKGTRHKPPEGYRCIAPGETIPDGPLLIWAGGRGPWTHNSRSVGAGHVWTGEGCIFAAVAIPLPKAPRKSPKLQETSLQAHKSQKDKAPLDRVAILARLRKYRTGTTCDKLEQVLNMSHQTTSARINDLVRMGKIVDSGRRAKTRTGRLAICWKAVEA